MWWRSEVLFGQSNEVAAGGTDGQPNNKFTLKFIDDRGQEGFSLVWRAAQQFNDLYHRKTRESTIEALRRQPPLPL